MSPSLLLECASNDRSRSLRLSSGVAGWLLGAALVIGCGPEVGTGNGSGSGGATASGGASASGGATASGGASASGGATASGGASATGGRAASGGESASGGTLGTGGRASGGATVSTGGSGVGGGNGGRVGGTGGSSASGGSGVGGGGGGAAPSMSAGCGKTATLKTGTLTIQSGGMSRKYMLRIPDGYDNSKPYRLILGFHGATGNATEVAKAQNNGYFGLYALAGGSTIFIATEAVGGLWEAARDITYVDDILKQVLPDLCIDTSRIEVEGFSQGAAMCWALVCAKPGVFRAAVGHSGGGVTAPSTCQPIAYFGSLGLQEGGDQTTQTDKFAKWNGCTIEKLPKAPTGGHLCSDYKGCSAGHPVRWCQGDAGHSPAPVDPGQSTSWMPKDVWTWLSQF